MSGKHPTVNQDWADLGVICFIIYLFISPHHRSENKKHLTYTFQQCGLNGEHRVKPLTCRHNSAKFKSTRTVITTPDNNNNS